MHYKVNDRVICQVEVQKNGTKRILVRDPLKDSKISRQDFQVVAINALMQTYMIIVDDGMIGWTVSRFHTKHLDVPETLIGKTFYDVSEVSIEGKK
jgi:hypothetical protein